MKERKIFLAGLGKTGTTTLHFTLEAAGLKSIHDDRWVKESWDCNREWFAQAEVFSDSYYDLPQDLRDRGVTAPNVEWLNCNYDGYFILNTRSLKSWAISMWNHGVRRHREGWGPELNSKENMIEHIKYRNTYHREVIEYFKEKNNFCFLNLSSESEFSVLQKLKKATGIAVNNLVTRNVTMNTSEYNKEPQEVLEALDALQIKPHHYDETVIEFLK